MEFKYEVTVVIDDRDKPSDEYVANMIRNDVGSWQGSLPSNERIFIKDVLVKSLMEPIPPTLNEGAKKWFWMMSYCYNKGLAPTVQLNWTRAEKAWDKINNLTKG